MSESDKAFEKWWTNTHDFVGIYIVDASLGAAALKAWHAAIHWKSNQLFVDAGRKRHEQN